MTEEGSYDVASAEARAGRRGLLDSGPHTPERRDRRQGADEGVSPPERKGKGICSGWADEEDYGPRYED